MKYTNNDIYKFIDYSIESRLLEPRQILRLYLWALIKPKKIQLFCNYIDSGMHALAAYNRVAK